MQNPLICQSVLSCPLCETSLRKISGSLVCENRHCYDFAKEGYINLLPPQQKKSKEPGDNKEMIHCRKNFLNKNFYGFLAPEIAQLIRQFNSINTPANLLDVGCGEGYFTDQIANHVKENNIAFYGMDISKEAVRLAAKRNKHTHWFVASSNKIPVKNNSLDIVIKINAPLNFIQLKNKLSNHAIVVSVTPGKKHLSQLRKTMYTQVQPHFSETIPEGFTLIHKNEVSKEISLTSKQDINNLFKMTPYFWNATGLARSKVAKLTQLETTASFNIQIYQATVPPTE